MVKTLSKHTRVAEDDWQRIEEGPSNAESPPNRLLVAATMEAIDAPAWPRTKSEIYLLRSAMFAAQAIARDMEVAGQGDEIQEIARNISRVAPDLSPKTGIDRQGPGIPMTARPHFPDHSEKCSAAVEAGNALNLNRWTEVPELLATLYGIVDRLESLFPGRKFTPDGHLVGSIGDVIAAQMFGLGLLPGSSPDHDATAPDGRKVQIKLTQGTRGVALRAEPEHLLALRLAPDRSIHIVYNGNGSSPWFNAGRMQKNGQRQISLARLRALDASIADPDRLPCTATIELAR